MARRSVTESCWFGVGVRRKDIGRRADRAGQEWPGQKSTGQADRPDQDPAQDQVAHTERQAGRRWAGREGLGFQISRS